jgi:hypothetical protein
VCFVIVDVLAICVLVFSVFLIVYTVFLLIIIIIIIIIMREKCVGNDAIRCIFFSEESYSHSPSDFIPLPRIMTLHKAVLSHELE